MRERIDWSEFEDGESGCESKEGHDCSMHDLHALQQALQRCYHHIGMPSHVWVPSNPLPFSLNPISNFQSLLSVFAFSIWGLPLSQMAYGMGGYLVVFA